MQRHRVQRNRVSLTLATLSRLVILVLSASSKLVIGPDGDRDLNAKTHIHTTLPQTSDPMSAPQWPARFLASLGRPGMYEATGRHDLQNMEPMGGQVTGQPRSPGNVWGNRATRFIKHGVPGNRATWSLRCIDPPRLYSIARLWRDICPVSIGLDLYLQPCRTVAPTERWLR